MENGIPSAGAHELAADTPVKLILQLMAQGVSEIVVTDDGRSLGMVRTAGLMAKLIDPRGRV